MVPPRPFRILVTRSPHQASELAERLRALGCEPVLIPAIEIVEPSSYAALDTALRQLHTFHWLLFTSANAVEAFGERMRHLSQPLPIKGALKGTGFSPSGTVANEEGALAPEGNPNLSHVKVAAIGSATARALHEIGIHPDLVPPQAIAESLTESLLPFACQPDGTPTRFLLIRAEEAREHLRETLRAAGAEVTIAPAYRTVIPKDSIESIRELFKNKDTWPDAITFTSSSSARNLFALLEAAGLPPSTFNSPRKPVFASIGPITSTTLRELDHPADIESAEATVAALAETLAAYLQTPR